MNEPLRVAVLGSGAVASALAPAIDALDGVEVVQVYSPTASHARELASRLAGAGWSADAAAVVSDAGLYIISVKDDAVAPLARRLAPGRGGVWVHTSGSVPMEALSGLSAECGVLYPLQTFSRERRPEIAGVPFFIEGSSPRVTAMLKSLAARLSPKVFDADSALRRKLHVAAVFACNFTNHLWAVAHRLLAEAGLPFDVLEPLIGETVRKALSGDPARGQTGPARRGDRKVMAAHEAMLEPEVAELYRILSNSIIRQYDSLRSLPDQGSGV